MIHTQDADFTLINADVLEGLRSLPVESVHCVVTSPPYWGLRDYGTGLWDGGDPDCDHKTRERGEMKTDVARQGYAPSSNFANYQAGYESGDTFLDLCGKCGARRQDRQLGLEPTPDEYVARMVEVFREVRRVLRRDGTCWLNIGDSYADANRHAEKRMKDASGVIRPVEMKECERCGEPFEGALGRRFCSSFCGGSDNSRRIERPGGLKAKDLVGIPWRLAFALQADGWYLRSDIIWAKPNPMPESVTDRPTKAHEYVFLLTRSPRYFFDQEAVREPHESTRWGGPIITQPPTTKYAEATADGFSGAAEALSRPGREWNAYPTGGRNVRSVWEIPTQPYPEAHFATYPEELVRRCILAGTSEHGCCPECGAPWERITEDHTPRTWKDERVGNVNNPNSMERKAQGAGKLTWGATSDIRTVGWRLGCDCGGGIVRGDERASVPPSSLSPAPCTVLDPFLGSGTTAYVARQHGRRSIGIELNPAYAELAARRMQQQSLLFA